MKEKTCMQPVENIEPGKRSGFTVIELLVIVAVLSGIILLASPYYYHGNASRSRNDAIQADLQGRIVAAQDELQNFTKALSAYEQLEGTPWTNNKDFRSLIGKYVKDFRTIPDQVLPRDPWNNDYVVDSALGYMLSKGPDGVDNTSASGKPKAVGDDILYTWKKQ
ncbi:MAG: type II secretion system protein [Candidatus Riflebacteria bacterium]|nr:type II secretion system protein [Candidatus Riflebacteria bacterium]